MENIHLPGMSGRHWMEKFQMVLVISVLVTELSHFQESSRSF